MRWFQHESPATTGWIKLLTKEFRQKREMTGNDPEALCFWQWRRGRRDFCRSTCFKTIARCFLSTYCVRGSPYALPCFPSGPTAVPVLLTVRGLLSLAVSRGGLTWEVILIKSSFAGPLWGLAEPSRVSVIPKSSYKLLWSPGWPVHFSPAWWRDAYIFACSVMTALSILHHIHIQ